jgi:hypothetical protein
MNSELSRLETPAMLRRPLVRYLGLVALCGLLVGLPDLVTYVGQLFLPPKVEVKGRVFYNGEPLTGGQVEFIVEGDYPAILTRNFYMGTGVIDEGGNYTVQVPVGKVRIRVDNRLGNQPLPNVAAIPRRYYLIESSGLSWRVPDDPTQRVHNIELTD